MTVLNEVDYTKIPLPDPDTKPYAEWAPSERRAYIYKMIMQEGIREPNTTVLAEKFQKSQPLLWKDREHVKEWISKNHRAEFDFLSQYVHVTGIKHYIDNEQYDEATKILRDWRKSLIDLDMLGEDQQDQTRLLRELAKGYKKWKNQ